MRIVINHFHPKIPCPRGRVETIRFAGHWFVRWLAKYLPFEPDILIVKPLLVDDPQTLVIGDTLFCSAAQADELRRALPSAPSVRGGLLATTPGCLGLGIPRPWFGGCLS